MTSRWPQVSDERSAQDARAFGHIQEMITGIRNLRSRYNVPPKQFVSIVISLTDESSDLEPVIVSSRMYFERLARVDECQVGIGLPKPPHCASVVAGTAVVHVMGLVDPEEERVRLSQELEQKQAFLERVQKKLANEQFVNRAPAQVVERERQKERDVMGEISRLQASFSEWAEDRSELP